MTQDISKLWSPAVGRLEPYVPGEQPKVANLIKLNTNESAFPPSPEVAQVITHAEIDKLRLYPDPNSQALRGTIADYYKVDIAQVFVGNGSDEVLAHAFFAFFQQAKPLLYPDISYSFYPVYCDLYNIKAEQVPLRADFRLDLTDYQRANGGIIFPNPNAPTAMGIPLADIRALLTYNRDSVVLVDEAYIDFGGESAIALVNEFENLLVVHTTSKSRALAGMRIGYAVGAEGLIDALVRVKNSFNSYPIDRLAELAGVASFRDEAYFQQGRQQVMQTRDRTVTALEKLGFTVLPSQANFVFAKPKGKPAKFVFEALREKNILVRYFSKPRIDEYLRISIGSPQEMEQFIQAIGEIMA